MKNLCNYLSSIDYLGRGLVLGKNTDDSAVVAYFIMGRSENSRNRVFGEENGNVTIFPFDSSKVTDPSLIIYSPLRIYQNFVVVSNGIQTDTIFDGLQKGISFEKSLNKFTYEPDSPNYTPRISGVFDLSDSSYQISILKRTNKKDDFCNRILYYYRAKSGVGHIIHTYQKDGQPLPSFSGQPREVKISADIDTFTQNIWENLNKDNKISLLVKYIKDGKTQTRIINKNL